MEQIPQERIDLADTYMREAIIFTNEDYQYVIDNGELPPQVSPAP